MGCNENILHGSGAILFPVSMSKITFFGVSAYNYSQRSFKEHFAVGMILCQSIKKLSVRYYHEVTSTAISRTGSRTSTFNKKLYFFFFYQPLLKTTNASTPQNGTNRLAIPDSHSISPPSLHLRLKIPPCTKQKLLSPPVYIMFSKIIFQNCHARFSLA